jgi:hypothetical protein
MAGNLTAMIAAAFSGGAAPPVTSDPYYEYTTLLLPGNGTNGAQNNTFLDSSTNNFTITRNGNTTQGTFSPFSQTGWGNYFNGGASNLNLPSSTDFALGSAFSFECWVFLTSLPNVSELLDVRTSNEVGCLYILTSGFPQWQNGPSTGSTITGSTAVTLNQWNYLLFVADANGCSIYLNGARVANTSQVATWPTSARPCFIGGAFGNSSGSSVNGYLSDVRLIKGSTPYNSTATSVTVPTTFLPFVTNTVLQCCRSNRFINTVGNVTMTVNGSPSVQAFSPFNPSASWSAATYGGSGYFDDSNDYLSYNTSNSNFAIGATDNFCVEAWVYYTSSPNYEGFFQADYSAGLSNCLWFGYNSGTLTLGRHASTNFATYTVTFTQGQWYHVVGVRQAGNVALFLNGTRVANSSSNTDTTTQNGFAVGVVYPSGYFGGYFGGTRFVRAASGTSMPYDPTQTSITVPTSPLTAVTGTQLLLNYTNAGIYDATSKNDLETVGNAQISTAQSKWGGSSMAFDGTGDYLYQAPTPFIRLGTGDFTCECWVRFNVVTGTQGIFQLADSYLQSSLSNNGVGLSTTSGTGWLFFAKNSQTFTYSPIVPAAANTWMHVALVRYSGTTKLYVNGTGDAALTASSDTTNYTATYLALGGLYGGNSLNGYIQDFRITVGVARYTANFTPPTAAFPTL